MSWRGSENKQFWTTIEAVPKQCRTLWHMDGQYVIGPHFVRSLTSGRDYRPSFILEVDPAPFAVSQAHVYLVHRVQDSISRVTLHARTCRLPRTWTVPHFPKLEHNIRKGVFFCGTGFLVPSRLHLCVQSRPFRIEGRALQRTWKDCVYALGRTCA